MGTRGAVVAEALPREDADRRLCPRYLPRQGVAVCWQPGTLRIGRRLPAQLIDLSDRGACFLVEEPVESGELIELTLRAPGWSEALSRTGVVVWSEPLGSSIRIGVLFSTRLEFKAFRELCHCSG